jgi:HPt (histidine-containing phosphotransfer) domain-containing protein
VREPEHPLLDEATLRELAASVGGDMAFVTELVEAYLVDAPQQIEQIRRAADTGDAASMVRPAHTLKSSSATVGALRLASRARRLELATRENDLDRARDDLAGLDEEWQATDAALRQWTAEVTSR